MKEQTKIIKIRLNRETKNELKKFAKSQYRTFCNQCRIILDDWSKNNE